MPLTNRGDNQPPLSKLPSLHGAAEVCGTAPNPNPNPTPSPNPNPNPDLKPIPTPNPSPNHNQANLSRVLLASGLPAPPPR